MAAPLSRLQDRLQALDADRLGLGEQIGEGGRHGELHGQLHVSRQPIDPWLVGQIQCLTAIDAVVWGPLDVRERKGR